MCEVSADINMSRHQKQPPSLEDALAKGFSELKIGEANLPEATPPAPIEESPPVPVEQRPIEYNKKYEAVEQREEFVVATPVHTNTDSATEEILLHQPSPVQEQASTSIGDEFDVEW
jgi:hypothetical protein